MQPVSSDNQTIDPSLLNSPVADDSPDSSSSKDRGRGKKRRKENSIATRIAPRPCRRCAKQNAECEIVETGIGRSCVKCRRGHRPCEWPHSDQEVSTAGTSLSPPGSPPHKRQKLSNHPSQSPPRLRRESPLPAGGSVQGSESTSVAPNHPRGCVTIFTADRVREMFEEMEQLIDWLDSDYEPQQSWSDSLQSAESGEDSMEEGLEDEAQESSRWTCMEDVENEYREHRRELRRAHRHV